MCFCFPNGVIPPRSRITKILPAFPLGMALILQFSSSCRFSVDECFRENTESYTIGKLIFGQREIGLKYVFDTNSGVDLNIIVPGKALFDKLQKNVKFPQLTSCCPAWMNYVGKTFQRSFLCSVQQNFHM
jgi:iron only hydrogenase large subunit-like protein